jgi:hypothetical protein
MAGQHGIRAKSVGPGRSRGSMTGIGHFVSGIAEPEIEMGRRSAREVVTHAMDL